MRTKRYSVILVIAVAACSGDPAPPGGSPANNTTSEPRDVGRTEDGSSTETPGADMSIAPDDGQSSSPDVGMPNPEPDASMLPTECRNDCLCESSCTHRCNIQCRAECASGTCDFALNAGGDITCRAGSTCVISCESGGCLVTCEPGASCELRCGPQAVACQFVVCEGERQSCSGRRETCDAACG